MEKRVLTIVGKDEDRNILCASENCAQLYLRKLKPTAEHILCEIFESRDLILRNSFSLLRPRVKTKRLGTSLIKCCL